MKKPEVEVIKLTEDVIRTSGNSCGDDCIPVQTECTPICKDNDPNTCDCVDGDD